MTRVTWGDPGSHIFQIGIDRGMLYVGPDGITPGVPWNGLISVVENPSGGQIQTYYQDGIAYYAENSIEEYQATLTAFYSPEEFDACDGQLALAQGMVGTAQRRAKFGLCYRNKLGNDASGQDLGYKLHLVYFALAEPTTQNYQTINDDPNISSLSWLIKARPLLVPGGARSAHFIVNSLKANPTQLAVLEDILYGGPESEPRLPYPWEVMTILDEIPDFQIIDNGDGTYTAISDDTKVSMVTDVIFQLTNDTVIEIDDVSYTASSTGEV